MEINIDETWEEYCLRKGYYYKVINALPCDINPEKFSYEFEDVMKVINAEEATIRNGTYYSSTRYTILNKNLSTHELYQNFTKMKSTIDEKNKKIREEYENNDKIRFVKLCNLIELIINKSNEKYMRELISEFVTTNTYNLMSSETNLHTLTERLYLLTDCSSMVFDVVKYVHNKGSENFCLQKRKQQEKQQEKEVIKYTKYKKNYELVVNYIKKQEIINQIETLKNNYNSIESQIKNLIK